jgi:hypothetical protein
MIVSPGKAKSFHLSQEQTALVRDELRAILGSNSFSGSKRCQDFLELVVDRAIAGDHEALTERFLGARLFGRAIDYETATDSIVRVRASDVRRRLVQYYSSQPCPAVRISLIPGGYIPEFHWKQEISSDAPSNLERITLPEPAGTATSHETASGLSSPAGSLPESRFGRPVWIIASLLCVIGIAIFAWNQLPLTSPQSDVDRFWAPVLRDRGEVLICFGDTTRFWVSAKLAAEIAQDPHSISIEPGQFVVTHDDTSSAGNLRASLSIMQLLDRHGIANELRWPQEVQAVDLDTRNTVFIGAFNNPWTMSLNSNLRFAFEQGGTPKEPVWTIRDRTSNRVWSMAKTDPQPIDHDFAIITRILDPVRKRVVMSVGGLNQFGTEAAGEFLEDEAALKEFARTAPKGWESKNIQIVLEMEVSNQKPVRPRIIAFNVW